MILCQVHCVFKRTFSSETWHAVSVALIGQFLLRRRRSVPKNAKSFEGKARTVLADFVRASHLMVTDS